jgi:hypothetical protein
MKEYPKDKIVRNQSGINRLKTLKDRKNVMKALVEEREKLLDEGFNPIIDNEIKALPLPQTRLSVQD